MIFAHVSLTPLCGAPWAAAEAFREAGHDSFCIAPAQYDSGRTVPTHYRVPPVAEAVARLHQADVIICHERWPLREGWYPPGKPTVIWHHRPRPEDGHSGRREPGEWPSGVAGGARTGHTWLPRLPELLPLEDRHYRPGIKPARRVRIACDTGDVGQDLGDLDAEVDVVGPVGLEESLQRKAAAHIVIEDLSTTGYRRGSIEALALGCVVVNACDDLHAWHVQQMTGGCGHPFEAIDPGRLRGSLGRLVALGPDALSHMGRRNRAWLEAAWRPTELIDRNLLPLVDEAIALAARHRQTGDGGGLEEPKHE